MRTDRRSPCATRDVVWGVHKAHVPAVMREDVVENGMDTDVAEMKPWRQAACSTLLRLIALFVVGTQSISEELLPAPSSLQMTPAFSEHRLDIMVDGEG